MNTHPLPDDVLKEVFIQELSILYQAKAKLISSLPKLAAQATFGQLKLALQEDLDDTVQQMSALVKIFHDLGQLASAEETLGMAAIIKEAEQQIIFHADNYYASDMSIIFYMNAIENLQIGACRVLRVIVDKPDFVRFKQLIRESLDMNKDNAKLFQVVAKEYLGLGD